MAPVTFEDIRVFLRCPYAYALDRTEAYPDKITVDECLEISVKEAVASFSRSRIMGRRPEEERALEAFWMRWDENVPRVYGANRDETMRAIRMGERCMRNFIGQCSGMGAEDIVASGMTGVQPLSGGHEVGICIEEVGRRGSTVFLTRYVVSPEVMSREDLSKDLEMRVSALWAMDRQGASTVALRWVFLVQSMSTQITAQRRDCEAAAALTASYLEQMSSGRDPLPRESDYCGVCPYQSRCPRFLHELSMKETGPDEGSALVDEFLDLEEKKAALRRRIELLDAEQDAVRARIVAYADSKGFMSLKGEKGKVLVRHEKKVDLPSDKTELIARLKETGQYEALSMPNYPRLRSEIAKGTADPGIAAMAHIEDIDKVYLPRGRGKDQ